VRTTAVRVRGGKRNVVQLVLPRAVAARLQSKRFTVTIKSGTTQGRLTTWAGTGALRIVAALVPKAGPGR
jgi:DNA-binding transcriptional regulator of glucitol operon